MESDTNGDNVIRFLVIEWSLIPVLDVMIIGTGKLESAVHL